MRELVVIITNEGQTVVERTPWPYSHSAPIDTPLFTMTAEEAENMTHDDRRVRPSGGQHE